MAETFHGSCTCGGVVFSLIGPLRSLVACHCGQCRRTSGHYWTATSVPEDRFDLLRGETLRWFRSSDTAERGFCRRCGASLFWRPFGEGTMHPAPGAFDDPIGLTIAEHIHTDDASDYYSIEGARPAARAGSTDRLDCACLCGKVRFAVPGPAGEITACHCRECRKLSGQYSASFTADEAAVAWHDRSGLATYDSPAGATRGFCNICGSSLWRRAPDGSFRVEAGAVVGPTGGHLARHVQMAQSAGYDASDDGLPCHAASS